MALVLTIAAGLLSRSGASWLPGVVVDQAGDALWSVALYCTLAFFWPRARVMTLFIGALAGSWLVEFSQLVHTPATETLRSYRAVRLLIGTTFVWQDLPRYLVGCAFAAGIDGTTRRRVRPQSAPAAS